MARKRGQKRISHCCCCKYFDDQDPIQPQISKKQSETGIKEELSIKKACD